MGKYPDCSSLRDQRVVWSGIPGEPPGRKRWEAVGVLMGPFHGRGRPMAPSMCLDGRNFAEAHESRSMALGGGEVHVLVIGVRTAVAPENVDAF